MCVKWDRVECKLEEDRFHKTVKESKGYQCSKERTMHLAEGGQGEGDRFLKHLKWTLKTG